MTDLRPLPIHHPPCPHCRQPMTWCACPVCALGYQAECLVCGGIGGAYVCAVFAGGADDLWTDDDLEVIVEDDEVMS